MSSKREITKQDFESVVEILNSLAIEVVNYDNVWSTMFFQTNEWALSLSVLNDIDTELREKTDFYLFSNSVLEKGDRTLKLCVGLKENE